MVLNRMALVGKLWHNALAPTAGACMPALTRQITLGAQDMLSVQELAQPWWGWIRGQKSVRIITDIEIVSLAAACPTIKRLELRGCAYKITDAALASLAAGCPAITTLELFNCVQITDAGLASLAAGCSAITTLYLCGCYHFTDTGLASLAAGCRAIATLDLECCNQVTDKGMASLVAGCPNIEIIN